MMKKTATKAKPSPGTVKVILALDDGPLSYEGLREVTGVRGVLRIVGQLMRDGQARTGSYNGTYELTRAGTEQAAKLRPKLPSLRSRQVDQLEAFARALFEPNGQTHPSATARVRASAVMNRIAYSLHQRGEYHHRTALVLLDALARFPAWRDFATQKRAELEAIVRPARSVASAGPS